LSPRSRCQSPAPSATPASPKGRDGFCLSVAAPASHPACAQHWETEPKSSHGRDRRLLQASRRVGPSDDSCPPNQSDQRWAAVASSKNRTAKHVSEKGAERLIVGSAHSCRFAFETPADGGQRVPLSPCHLYRWVQLWSQVCPELATAPFSCLRLLSGLSKRSQ
jgi:hypothetical protein